MENNEANAKQMGLDEALAYNKQVQAETQANAQYVKIANHETVLLPFANPPIIYKKMVSGTDTKDGRAYTSEQLEFELRVKTPDGKAKTWSIGANNKIVPEVLEMLKSGVYDIKVHREGEGPATKYSISKERAL